MAKYKFSSPVTPRGVFLYAWIDKPDTKFKENGEYKCTVLIEDTEENRAWVETQKAKAAKEAKEEGSVKLKKKFKFPAVMPEDIDEEDFEPDEDGNAKYGEEVRGKIMIEAKSGFKPGAIDSLRNALPDDVKIMRGDEGKMKVRFQPYDGFGGGITLRLVTVQLLQKNTTFSQGPNTDGFDDDEDGYISGEGNENEAEEEDDEIPF